MRFLCCVGSAAIAAACCVPFFCFPASAVDSTVSLTVAQTLALFGNSIDCEYLSTDGTYHSITATFDGYTNNYITGIYYVDDSGSNVNGRYFVNYSFSFPSDMDVTSSSVSVLFKTSVDISSLTYFDSALVTYSNISTSTQLYGTYVGYWYCSDGYHYTARQGASGTSLYNYYGYVTDNYGQSDIIIPCIYASSSNTTFKTGWANIGTFGTVGRVQIGVVCPIISENWVYDGSSGAGSGESSGGGSDSGSGSTDLSGVMTKLDSIIAKLDQIVANTSGGSSSEDSSQNASDQAAVNSMAADQSSKYDQANSYQDNVYEVADLDGVSLPDLENSYTDIPADFSKFWYIDGHATFFVTMLLLTSGVAVVAFIIFGKTF